MEVGFHSYYFERGGRIYSQSVLFFILAFGFFLWGNVVVFADSSKNMSIEKDSRIPITERVLDPSKNWRAPKKSENLGRESEEHKMKIQKGRIKKKSSPLYDPNNHRDNWDPYSFRDNQGVHTQPPTLFKFRF